MVAGCGPAPHRLLGPQVLLAGRPWLENRDSAWYEARIPFFDSPDSAINDTYYYRWELVTRHLTYGSPETGYTFSEFIDRPFWSGAFGAISCPLGHQFYEVRWLKDPGIVEDFARYWFETPGAEPRSYSNWYGDAMWASYLVTADSGLLHRVLPHMLAQYAGWVRERFDSTHGMFRWDGMHDGMETNIDSRQTAAPFDGGEGYRPTLNSYLYADARAISQAAGLFGDLTTAREYQVRAARLKERVQQELWDPSRQFFFQQFARDEQDGIRAGQLTYQGGRYAGSPHGREEIGFVPWQFNLPDSGYEGAWRFLTDTAYFMAPYGPTTTERHDPQFFISPRCCVWSGNSWPYATTQTLVAMANLLENYHQRIVSKDDWFRVFRTYTLTQRLDGRPFIAEAANPDNGSWDGHNSFDHSEHYFHSGYVDLVITGLAGLRPRADDTLEVNPLAPDEWPWFALEGVGYHGHRLTIVWDRDGRHYHRGAGLRLWADGQPLASAPGLGRIAVRLPPAPALSATERQMNYAVNTGRSAYPWVTASFTATGTSPHYLIDGQYWYDVAPPNRWTSAGSGQSQDTLVLDFGTARPVDTLRLYFLDDGSGVRAPAGYDVAWWDGAGWRGFDNEHRVPETPTGHRATVIAFPTVTASRIRAVLRHQPGSASGLTEVEAWGPALHPVPPPSAPPRDIAFNPGGQAFPRASASYTWRGDRVTDVNDMRFAFSSAAHDRWTAWQSPNRSDWVQLDFGVPRKVGRLDLFLWGDGRGVKAPRRYTVQWWDGTRWADARELRRSPVEPATWTMNSVWIEPVETQRVRVLFEHEQPAASGLTELMIWEPE